ncbi:MAG: acyltransferase [Acetobacteraceae bacterium]|nr:acyltransferase [Acetobacteraceae bacterium]
MSGRIVFANQLRGVAAAAVAASHLGGVYWLIRPAVTAATFTPPLQGPNPPFTAFFLLPWFNLGPLGVGLFFLISGLVIPISLQKHSPGNFLLARLLRIYPTYAAALLIEVTVLYANARYWGRPFGHGAWTVLSNCLLIQDLVGQPSIDLVNWTLCVELRFYLVMALVAGAVRRGSVAVLLAVGLAALGVNLAVVRLGVLGPPAPDPLLPSYTVSVESLFIVFMLIGVLFNYHLRGRLGTTALIAWVGVFGALFVVCWRTSAIAAQYPWVTKNYGYALALFGLLYALRRWVPDSRALDALAAISFPFYLVHSLIGYSVLKLLMLSWGWSYPASLAVSIAGVALLATGLHAAVETPTMRVGQALTPRTLRPRPEPAPVGVIES